MPLAMLWPDGIEDGTRIDALVNLSDLAPTFLELAGVEIPDRMTAHSLVPLMTDQETIRDQPHWQRVFTARERHTVSQEHPITGGYPMRAIRTADFLYIYNVKPDRWPGGTPNRTKAQKKNAWLSDSDNGPTKFYMWANRDQPYVKRLYDLSYAKRPQEELYDLARDPYQMNNVADNPNYSEVKKTPSKTADQGTQVHRRSPGNRSGGKIR